MKPTFCSDNYSSVHPEVFDAMLSANEGHEPSYGDDRYTSEAQRLFREEFGEDVHTLFVTTGTAANILSLKLLLTRPYEAVMTDADSHVQANEVGAPAAILGTQVFTVEGTGGKIEPEALEAKYSSITINEFHSTTPKVLSIAQSTEYGTVYTSEEVQNIAEWAHGRDMYVHMDGCRLPNAAVAQGLGLREASRDLGVDVLSFGGAKNGLMNAEAVVVFNAPDSVLRSMQKQVLQLSSKMRYVSSQFIPYLEYNLWHRNAARSNRLAERMAESLRGVAGLALTQTVETNQLFMAMEPELKAKLHDEGHSFYDWTPGEVRLVTSWDNSEEDIDGFIADAARLAR